VPGSPSASKIAASSSTVPPWAVVPASGVTSRCGEEAATTAGGAAIGSDTDATSRRPEKAANPEARRRIVRGERSTVDLLGRCPGRGW
jgi:hypothetical protein